jgi:hypothetical protein
MRDPSYNMERVKMCIGLKQCIAASFSVLLIRLNILLHLANIRLAQFKIFLELMVVI